MLECWNPPPSHPMLSVCTAALKAACTSSIPPEKARGGRGDRVVRLAICGPPTACTTGLPWQPERMGLLVWLPTELPPLLTVLSPPLLLLPPREPKKRLLWLLVSGTLHSWAWLSVHTDPSISTSKHVSAFLGSPRIRPTLLDARAGRAQARAREEEVQLGFICRPFFARLESAPCTV